ncbi:hypothetical protein [Streptomyces poriticola]|uniref:hypothetical protein n=1 Tax=Streptomyces poriticola TaxID=3120506 RepID=UPI002FCE0E32
MRTTMRRAGAVVLPVLVLAALLAPGAEASGSADAWVTVGTPPPGSTLQTVQGTRDRDGNCAFALSAVLAPGETAVRGDQVRVDPATCVTEVAVTRDGAPRRTSTATPSRAPGTAGCWATGGPG